MKKLLLAATFLIIFSFLVYAEDIEDIKKYEVASYLEIWDNNGTATGKVTTEGNSVTYVSNQWYNFSIYRTINQSVCDSRTFILELKNQTRNMNLILKNSTNQSDCNEVLAEYKGMSERQAEKLLNKASELDGLQEQIKKCDNQTKSFNDCKSQQESLQTSLNSCEQEKTDQKNNVMANPIIMIAIGAGGMWFLLNQKKKTGFSEYDTKGEPPIPERGSTKEMYK